jgi:hypothetical protein
MQAKSSPKTRRAVLGFVLFEHPDSTVASDLRREIGEDADQAVADLTAVGLIERDGELVRATIAAVHFDALRLP